MSKYMYYIFIIFFFTLSCKKNNTKDSFQKNNLTLLNYELLSKNHIAFNPIDIEYKKIDTSQANDCNLSIFSLDTTFSILHYYNDSGGAYGNCSEECKETIFLKDKHFSMPINCFFVQKAYNFSYNNVNYLLIHILNRKMIGSGTWNHWILLNLKSSKSYQFINADTLPAFINDFNADNNLDYLDRKYNNDTIYLYSLNNSENFEKSKLYLITQNSPRQDSLDRLLEITSGELLDRKNSKWYYKIK